VSTDAHVAYLEAEVSTATPQRLRLMLIEGALRHARQCLHLWQSGPVPPAAYDSLQRCRAIVAELHGVIKADSSPVARQVAEIYVFLFRLLAQASLDQEPQRVREAIEVLEEERETWRQVCEKMPNPPAGFVAGDRGQPEITAADAQQPAAGYPQQGGPPTDAGASGLSLEA
jgi:flagellar protein FliS